jgi:hypothetical protein
MMATQRLLANSSFALNSQFATAQEFEVALRDVYRESGLEVVRRPILCAF